MKQWFKRITSLLLAVILLCTPVQAFSLEDIPKDLFSQEQIDAVLENAQIKEKARKSLDDVQAVNDEIKAMSDEELRQTIVDLAEEYHIPALNDEQLNFLVDLCRSPEKIEDIANTIEEYGQKIIAFQQAVQTLTETLGSILEKLTGILDSLSGLLGKAAE